MGKYKIEIFFLIIVLFVFLFVQVLILDIIANLLLEIVMNFSLKLLYVRTMTTILKYLAITMEKMSLEIINGIKDVFVSVNNEPVSDVSLSFPQGNRWFWEDFYLMKIFSCDIKLRSGTNVITIKSGKRKEKIIVHVGSD